jgi:hypothetical protein
LAEKGMQIIKHNLYRPFSDAFSWRHLDHECYTHHRRTNHKKRILT